jgi:hypothetical protein
MLVQVGDRLFIESDRIIYVEPGVLEGQASIIGFSGHNTGIEKYASN